MSQPRTRLSHRAPLLSLLALLPLLACAPGKQVCIGDCEDTTGATGTTSNTTPDVDSASTSGPLTTAPTDGGDTSGSSGPGSDATTTAEAPTTGEPGDACTIAGTIALSRTCLDGVHQPGEFCLGTGSGTPLLPADIVSFVAGPLDGLAGVDLLVSHPDRTVSWALDGPGPSIDFADHGMWPMAFPPDALILTGAGDFDEDGNLDAIARRVGGTGDSVEILVTDGAAQLLDTTSVPVGPISFGPEAVDWDGDGNLDIVVVAATEDSPVTRVVLQGDGAGNFTTVLQHDFIGPVGGLHAVGAIDADGVHDDFVVIDADGKVAIKSGNSVAFTDLELGPGAMARHLAVAELDGDGLGDFVALLTDTAGGVAWLWVALQTDEPLEFTVTSFPVRCGATTFALGDVDQDGALDVVAGGPDDAMVTVRLGDGDGGFSQVTAIELGSADVLRIADFSGDGANELAAIDVSAGTLSFAFSSP